ncbi:glycosyltransferase family 9 protein [Acanthopleuribacter pedis]|uniref:Glycosyltransferase family 9 protein n=1 Tax=Acanthopleuribacter pedis TaxID=442870 RepID=A0A8J7Q653_9BACT|nr:glycosyltransferase family 9 protein [Acanthopleuribacter pedis]MBO1318399.1 glycosyltransferase family 9 protein [Acanthopleuribacter pedis]
MPSSPTNLDGRKVLIVRLSALGDVIRTMPSVLALMNRFPDAEFSWLVEDSSAGFLKAVRGPRLVQIERAALRRGGPAARFKAWQAVKQRITAEQFDISIDFHGVAKSALFPLLAGIPHRVGYERGGSKEGARWLINDRLQLPSPHISRYDRNLALARAFDPELTPVQPQIELNETASAKVEAAMPAPALLLFPGTSDHGRNKRWPAKYWAWLYRNLTRGQNRPVRFVFGPADGAYRDQLCEHLGEPPDELPPLNLVELGAALQRAHLLVSCDTGPMHLASILGVPIVALMGPSDPVLNQPQPGNRRMIIPETPCAPCRNRSCQSLICQDLTTPYQVLQEVRELSAQLEAAS